MQNFLFRPVFGLLFLLWVPSTVQSNAWLFETGNSLQEYRPLRSISYSGDQIYIASKRGTLSINWNTPLELIESLNPIGCPSQSSQQVQSGLCDVQFVQAQDNWLFVCAAQSQVYGQAYWLNVTNNNSPIKMALHDDKMPCPLTRDERNYAFLLDTGSGSGSGSGSPSNVNPSSTTPNPNWLWYVGRPMNKYLLLQLLQYNRPHEKQMLYTEQSNQEFLQFFPQSHIARITTESEYVYTYFHEPAEELNNPYGGQADYHKPSVARVARVCKRDPGPVRMSGQRSPDQFISFVKTRLVCQLNSQSNNQPIMGFNYMTDARHVFSPIRQNSLVFGVFTSVSPQEESLWGAAAPGQSAICAFSLRDMDAAFSGPFLAYNASLTGAYSMRLSQVENPPESAFMCPKNFDAAAQSQNQIRSKDYMSRILMERPALSIKHGDPLATSDSGVRWDRLEAEWLSTEDSSHIWSLLYVMGSDGVLRTYFHEYMPSNRDQTQAGAVMGQAPSDSSAGCLIERIDLAISLGSVRQSGTGNDRINITGFSLVDYQSEKYLLILSEMNMVKVKLHLCSRILSKSECISGSDPFCGWDRDMCVVLDTSRLRQAKSKQQSNPPRTTEHLWLSDAKFSASRCPRNPPFRCPDGPCDATEKKPLTGVLHVPLAQSYGSFATAPAITAAAADASNSRTRASDLAQSLRFTYFLNSSKPVLEVCETPAGMSLPSGTDLNARCKNLIPSAQGQGQGIGQGQNKPPNMPLGAAGLGLAMQSNMSEWSPCVPITVLHCPPFSTGDVSSSSGDSMSITAIGWRTRQRLSLALTSDLANAGSGVLLTEREACTIPQISPGLNGKFGVWSCWTSCANKRSSTRTCMSLQYWMDRASNTSQFVQSNITLYASMQQVRSETCVGLNTRQCEVPTSMPSVPANEQVQPITPSSVPLGSGSASGPIDKVDEVLDPDPQSQVPQDSSTVSNSGSRVDPIAIGIHEGSTVSNIFNVSTSYIFIAAVLTAFLIGILLTFIVLFVFTRCCSKRFPCFSIPEKKATHPHITVSYSLTGSSLPSSISSNTSNQSSDANTPNGAPHGTGSDKAPLVNGGSVKRPIPSRINSNSSSNSNANPVAASTLVNLNLQNLQQPHQNSNTSPPASPNKTNTLEREKRATHQQRTISNSASIRADRNPDSFSQALVSKLQWPQLNGTHNPNNSFGAGVVGDTPSMNATMNMNRDSEPTYYPPSPSYYNSSMFRFSDNEHSEPEHASLNSPSKSTRNDHIGVNGRESPDNSTAGTFSSALGSLPVPTMPPQQPLLKTHIGVLRNLAAMRNNAGGTVSTLRSSTTSTDADADQVHPTLLAATLCQRAQNMAAAEKAEQLASLLPQDQHTYLNNTGANPGLINGTGRPLLPRGSNSDQSPVSPDASKNNLLNRRQVSGQGTLVKLPRLLGQNSTDTNTNSMPARAGPGPGPVGSPSYPSKNGSGPNFAVNQTNGTGNLGVQGLSDSGWAGGQETPPLPAPPEFETSHHHNSSVYPSLKSNSGPQTSSRPSQNGYPPLQPAIQMTTFSAGRSPGERDSRSTRLISSSTAPNGIQSLGSTGIGTGTGVGAAPGPSISFTHSNADSDPHNGMTHQHQFPAPPTMSNFFNPDLAFNNGIANPAGPMTPLVNSPGPGPGQNCPPVIAPKPSIAQFGFGLPLPMTMGQMSSFAPGSMNDTERRKLLSSTSSAHNISPTESDEGVFPPPPHALSSVTEI